MRMALLFVNACMREGSRTERLARTWLDGYPGEVEEVRLADLDVTPLDARRLARYYACVSAGDYTDEMFSFAHQFAAADEILIAAPFWNYGIPARLHEYLELVCSQGVTFDVGEDGEYVSLVKAHRLTFMSTAGGDKPEQLDDHGYGYVRTLSTCFWHIPVVRHIGAWNADADEEGVDALAEEIRQGAFSWEQA